MNPGHSFSLLTALGTDDPITQLALGLLLLSGLLATVFVIGPVVSRVWRATSVARRAHALATREDASRAELREDFAKELSKSVVAAQWREFERRWRDVAKESGHDDRTAVRFGEVLIEQPIVPAGVRRSLLGSLPGTFIALGVLGTFVGLTLATSHLSDIDAPATESATAAPGGAAPEATRTPRASADRASAVVAQLTSNLGLAFRTSVLGLLFSIFFSIVLRAIHGASQRVETELEQIVELVFPPVTAAELDARGQKQQADLFGSLKDSLTDLMTEYQELSRAGFDQVRQSLEQMTSNVSEKQRLALDEVARNLNESLKEGIGVYLVELRTALEEAVRQQHDLSERVGQAFARIDDSVTASQEAASQMTVAAGAVGGASDSLASCSRDLVPALSSLNTASTSLERTATSITASQEAAERTVTQVSLALEQAQGSLDQQREMVETSLGELRASISELSRGLADDLVQALGRIDGLMESALGRLSGTVGESNETLDRLARPLGQLDDAIGRVSASIDRSGAEVGSLSNRLDERLSHIADLGSALEDYANAQTAAQATLQVVLENTEQSTVTLTDLGRRFMAQADSHASSNESLAKLAERVHEVIALMREQQRNTLPNLEVAAIEKLGAGLASQLTELGRQIEKAVTSVPAVTPKLERTTSYAAPSTGTGRLPDTGAAPPQNRPESNPFPSSATTTDEPKRVQPSPATPRPPADRAMSETPPAASKPAEIIASRNIDSRAEAPASVNQASKRKGFIARLFSSGKPEQ